MASQTSPLPKSCLTECLRRSQDNSSDNVSKPMNPVQTPSLQAPKQDETEDTGVNSSSFSSSLSTLFGRGGGGGCDILKSICITPPSRPKNPLVRDALFGTSTQEKYKNEMVQYTNLMNKCVNATNWLAQSESPGRLEGQA
eukprot:TRINITY_DN57_c1_g1_i13.p6 TRINITY_DN57_c1_g1~~TRINITY_DN57_c1_g1_i13.p6  ORF type:complete len:141 (-),score=23.75 TRINITY_DN57_c1_g1_i13:2565-2987(-)